MTPLALDARDLRVDLRTPAGFQPLVQGVDLALAAGEITGLAGASGSGKSLTALALMGLTAPHTFRIHCASLQLDGKALDPSLQRAMRAVRGPGIAMVFQDPATALDPVFTVGSQLRRVIRRLPGMSRRQAAVRALDALRAVGFKDPALIARRYPHELSGGMRQLCVIAMAHAVRPSVLLADEPTTALDACTQAQVLDQLQRLTEACGTAVLLITHDLRLLARYARQVSVMFRGRIVEQLESSHLHEPGRHPYTASLIEALPRLHGRRHEPGRTMAQEAPAHDRPPGTAEWTPATPDSPALLSVRDLSSGYRTRRSGWLAGHRLQPTVHGVSMDLHAGRIHGLAGESGSGKSTLARTLVGLVSAVSGSVRLAGRELLEGHRVQGADARRRIQLVFQDPAASLSPRRTIAQILREPARHFGLDSSAAALSRVLETVGLDDAALERLPSQFSSGQRQRIAIARALICEPDLLIADEALASLDVRVQAQVLDVFRRLRDQHGLCLLLISHDLAVLAENADDTSVMHQGRLVEQGPTRRLFEQPTHPYTRQLLDAVPRFEP